ncbi:Cerato-platanin [Daedaleopsis nitida]|nr:Cerato-platanin [Daedaleopsis nitida]
MKLFALAVILFLIHASLAQVMNVTVSYDTAYDMANQSVSTVSCSQHLMAENFTTFNKIPRFPFIGGSFVVTGFDAPGCDSCWELTFGQSTIRVRAIDHAGPGTFNVALEAMDALTNNQAQFFGRVNATAMMVDRGECGPGSKKVGPPGH